MKYHPKHAWRSLRSPRYQAIRTATYQPKHSWTYSPTDFRYKPAQDKRRTIQDAKVIIQRYRDLGWSIQQIGRNLSINPAEVAACAAEE